MLKRKQFIHCLSILAFTYGGTVSAQTVLPEVNSYNNPSEVFSIPIEVLPPENNNIPPSVCNPSISPNIEGIMKRYGGSWGILVERLSDGETIYQYNADRGFIPASNMKILTTAAALQRLSPQTTISANKSLQEWVGVTLLRSNNYYADTLLKKIGGGVVAKQTLINLGINPQGFHFADGSGLSRRNLATPRVLVDTLKVMSSNPQRDIFFTSLPTAGMSGTLRNRMKQTPVQGIVHAKTGTLTGVRALSGYLDHREYGTLVFSILANSPNQSGAALVKGIDEIVINLNNTYGCQSSINN
ncbi:MAG: peptidase S13 [Cyanobacteria bacterium]|nr:peptidase S13 [Cyanobacteria bacterium CG_2015-16_32_12]NCO77396.1 peptidase S13 [Cyanobacteria bacterium CG_2015-22_32_23]NCQ04355.1 peptidase S13 [Cyanobacteria bacterium CG_2015-09_32_10]NCQ42253.1 peptidase S13 [Cyanobacteria bacterium CG_2015-04_32_10]NCS83947.1 peptidase S13 [Cyanobacteria bacterium CG_2015-02_32_10]